MRAPAGSVAVVMPSYNAARYVREALASVLAQSRPADAIVVADDASTDGTADAAAACGERVRVLRNRDNKGPGARRNQAVMATSTDYVAFMDSDDLLEPSHIEILAGLLDRYPEADAAFTRLREFGSRDGVWPNEEVCPIAPKWIFPEHMRNIVCISTGMMVRRTAFNRIGGFSDMAEFYRGRRVQAEDYDFTLRLSVTSKFVATIQPTYLHRWHEGQSSIHVAPQRIQQFRYRLRLIERMRAGEFDHALLSVACEKTRMCWEEWLEWHWRQRDIEGVRLMVAFGMGEPLLRPATEPYVWKSRLPSFVARLAAAREGS